MAFIRLLSIISISDKTITTILLLTGLTAYVSTIILGLIIEKNLHKHNKPINENKIAAIQMSGVIVFILCLLACFSLLKF